MTESAFWHRVQTGLRAGAKWGGALEGLRLDRIENSVGIGIADVTGVYCGCDFWIELKVARGFRVKFEPGQVAWLEGRWRCGSAAFVLVAREGNARMNRRSKVYLYRGEQAGDLERVGLAHVKPEAAFTTPMQARDWNLLLGCFTWGV